LIASLRAELATVKSSLATANSLHTDLSKTQSSLSTAEARIATLNNTLTESQSENKALQAKIAALRMAPASADPASSVHTKAPGSAMKSKVVGRGAAGNGDATATAALTAQLKEDLYSDLTGLILRGVERGPDADVYDCIQTGRNGSKSFTPYHPGAREGFAMCLVAPGFSISN
jgi:hypothetical protein